MSGTEVQPLGPEERLLRRITGGETHTYRIPVEAGQFLRVVAEQKGADLVLKLIGPDGEPVTEIDSPSGATGPESLSLVADDNGEVRVDVDYQAAADSSGEYEIRIDVKRRATERDRTRVAAERAFAEGEKLRRDGRWEAAISSYQRAAGFWRSLGDREGEAAAQYRTGWMYQDLNQWDQALKYCDLAVALYQALGDRGGESVALNRKGGVLLHLGRYDEALAAHERAARIARENGDVNTEASAQTNLGTVHLWSGRTQKAVNAYDHALELWRQLEKPTEEFAVLFNLGELYLARDKRREARQAYEAALATAEQAGNQGGMATVLGSLGELEHREGRLAEAREKLARALGIQRRLRDRRGEAFTLNTLGTALLKERQLDPARERYQQALEIYRSLGDAEGEGVSLSNLGRYEHERGDFPAALRRQRAARAIFARLGVRPGMAFTRFGAARALVGLGRLEDADEELQASLRFVESLRAESQSLELRSSFFAAKQHYWDLHIDVLMKLDALHPNAGYAARAFQASERRRFRSLLDALAGARAEIRRGVDPALAQEERRLLQRLDRLEGMRSAAASEGADAGKLRDHERESQELFARLDRVRSRLREASLVHADLVEPRTLSLAEVQNRVLDKDTVLLAYSLGEERSFLWVVTMGSFASHTLPGRRQIEGLASRFHRLVRSAGASSKPARQDAGAELSEILLAPAATELERFPRVLVAPDGALQQIPMAALPIPGGDGAPMVTWNEIVYLPSASVLGTLQRRMRRRTLMDQARPLLAVIADPVFQADDERVTGTPETGPRLPGELARTLRDLDLSEIERLHYTRREAEEIRRVSPEEPLVAMDFEASRALIESGRLKDYRILHFATHSLIDNRQPELSGLVLSLVDAQGRPRNDGFLRLHEIYDLDLSADLVVLSACETGTGEEVRGEGLVSLTRAFMYAGVPQMVVSLWKVDDLSTSELMARFYREYLDEGEEAPRALREAQRSMYCDRRWTEPHHWAGFVFQGSFGQQGGSEDDDGDVEAQDTGGTTVAQKPKSDLPPPAAIPRGCKGGS